MVDLQTTGAEYYSLHEFHSTLGEQEVRFYSKPGLPQWRTVTPSAALIATQVQLYPAAKVLYLGCGHGAAALALARQHPACELWLTDTSLIACQLTERNFSLAGGADAKIFLSLSDLARQPGGFDFAILDLPKGRQTTQRFLAAAYLAVHPKGQFFLSGPNDQGIQPAGRDAEALFGKPAILGYKKGCRIFRFSRPDDDPARRPEWFTEPGVFPGSWKPVPIQVHSQEYSLVSLPGVFSSDHLDEGTALLIDALPGLQGEHVLDLGCGYGILGIYAASLGAASVDLVDVNLFAIEAARKNLEQYAPGNTRAIPSDALGAVLDRRYTCVVTNPPFHSGRSVDYQMAQAFIEGTALVLEPGGKFWLVSNRFIRYETLLQRYFCRVTLWAETSRYQVWLAVR